MVYSGFYSRRCGEGNSMRKLIAAGLAASAALAGSGRAYAVEYPWCTVDAGSRQCIYSSREECGQAPREDLAVCASKIRPIADPRSPRIRETAQRRLDASRPSAAPTNEGTGPAREVCLTLVRSRMRRLALSTPRAQ